ncbi:MAG: DUF6498-containing protein [Halohasta sp.]
MRSPTDTDRGPSVAGFVPMLFANLIPLVGVAIFGWEPSTVVVIYTLELLLSFPLAGVKALFAQQPPPTDREEGLYTLSGSELVEKRGRVEVVDWLPPVYPRNVPFAAAVGGAAAWCGLLIGVVLSQTIPLADVIARPEVVASVSALFVGQSVEVWRDYLRGGRYETVSPYTVIETPGRQAFFLVFVLFVIPGISVSVDLVFGVFVGLKLLVEWSAFRASHGEGGQLSGWLSVPDEPAESPDRPPVPDSEPVARVPTDRTSTGWTAVLYALANVAPTYAGWFAIVWLAVIAILGEALSEATVAASAVAVIGLFVAAVGLKAATYYLRYGTVEYRRYDDMLVAYDTWLDEPQWSTPISVLRDVEVVADRLPDRLRGTRTVSLTTGWGDDERTRQLGPVADPDALSEAFELPVGSTDLEPLKRRGVAVMGLAVGLIVVAAGVLVVGPWPSAPALLYLLVFMPFVSIGQKGFWSRQYSETR